jgi:selenocysteine-specific elongation factor
MPEQPIDRSFVIGTAGHIDHGKSTLVKALTGTDPDRLAEEKARGMTIDLGFAWLRTPEGRSVSIVDVPGHERFIKNMLAGVGGIDAALLVIAADEGPMPQTDEHLAILDLLQVKTGIVVLAKADLVDADWLELVADEVRQRVAGTVLADAPLVSVSATTGIGLQDLLTEIDAMLATVPPRDVGSKPRLPIDRVFTVQGFGTVVTGTLIGGDLAVGQSLTVMPRGLSTRVRGLQTHARQVERAQPGSRVATNVAGLDVADLRRGDVLTPNGVLRPSQRVDARLRLLPNSPVALEQNDQVDFFTGATELPGWLTLLDRERFEPGETGWVQIRFREPLAVLSGDRFIVRRPSPSLTIGGGEIVDPDPIRHRRFRPEVLDALETMAAGSPDEIVLQTLDNSPAVVKSLRERLPSALSPVQIDAALEQLVAEGDLLVLTGDDGPGVKTPRSTDAVIASTAWSDLSAHISALLQEFHAAAPLRRGMPKEELKSRLRIPGPPKLFEDVLRFAARQRLIADDGSTVRLAEFRITLSDARRMAADKFLTALRANPFAPPSPDEHGIDGDTLGALVDLGEVIRVADGVVYHPAAYARIEEAVVDLLERNGSITIAGYRDHFQSSRKYAQATLEYLDQRRITRRVGDERVRYTGAGAGRRAGGNE